MAEFTFDRAVEMNQGVDRQKSYTLSFKVRDKGTGDYIDLSTSQFQFYLRDSNGNIVWNIENNQFTRADIYSVSFTKTVSQVSSVAAGLYSASLLVTNSTMTNNEVIYGTWQFKS
jgi:hypothetical protein